MVRVAFLGSRPLGAYSLRLLMNMPSVEIVTSVVKARPANAWWTEDPVDFAPNVAESHDALRNTDFDFGVSINYWRILESDIIEKPRLGFINIHHSYNLSLRGRDMTTHAIINARDSGRWYHGTSLHYTDDGLDTGPIIASMACPIAEQDTAWSLFQKTESVAETLLQEWLPRLVIAKAPTASPQHGHPLNKRGEQNYRFIPDLFADPTRSYDIVRAYEFSEQYEGASTEIEGQKVLLTVTPSTKTEVLLRIDTGRAIYRKTK